MIPRVTQYWNVDKASVHIHRERDRRIITKAMLEAENQGSALAQDIVWRSLPRAHTGDSEITPQELGFNRDDTRAVLGMLIDYREQLPGFHLLSTRRITSLIGEIAIAAPEEIKPTFLDTQL